MFASPGRCFTGRNHPRWSWFLVPPPAKPPNVLHCSKKKKKKIISKTNWGLFVLLFIISFGAAYFHYFEHHNGKTKVLSSILSLIRQRQRVEEMTTKVTGRSRWCNPPPNVWYLSAAYQEMVGWVFLWIFVTHSTHLSGSLFDFSKYQHCTVSDYGAVRSREAVKHAGMSGLIWVHSLACNIISPGSRGLAITWKCFKEVHESSYPNCGIEIIRTNWIHL